MKLIVQKVADGIFNFCESSNGTDYDGMIYGGTDVKLSYTGDALKVAVTTGEVGVYDLTDLNYDDGNEIIGFASMNEFIIALKDAGFTGNFNTPQAGGVEFAILYLIQGATDAPIINEELSYNMIGIITPSYVSVGLYELNPPLGKTFNGAFVTCGYDASNDLVKWSIFDGKIYLRTLSGDDNLSNTPIKIEMKP